MTVELRALEELLKHKIGLDPTSVGPQLILRAVKLRMRDLKLDDLACYERLVEQSSEELQELIEEVVVAESWFFRDERPFEWLRVHVRKLWKSTPARAPIRILSMPCAGGEEPYSIAIALREEGIAGNAYRIDAVDASARRLAIARRGIYSKNAFRGPGVPSRSRYFREHAEGFEIDLALRSAVHFIQGSILDPRLLAGSSTYDVVFCRNLLIYLDSSAREALLALVERVLGQEGVLVIGHADRLDSIGGRGAFAPTGEAGCFAYRRKTGGELSVSVVSLPAQRPSLASLNSPHPVGAIEGKTAPQATPIAPRVSVPVSSDIVNSGAASPLPLLSQASELANQGRSSEAISICERHLKEKGVDAPAYSLMGMIWQASGDHGRAEECFRKAVYLDPNHDEALLALALLAEHRGDQRAAAGFRRRAERTASGARKRVN
jgi:chemotaxis protein methyltransferase WspC